MSHALYPFESHVLDRDGLAYHYLDEGSGDLVLMLHGNPSWSFYYRDLVKALRPDHRCVVPDHIGMGMSDKPGDDRYRYVLESRIDDVERLVDSLTLDRKLTLVLHDWGGMIGMGYAVRHPERIGRIVLLNTAAFHLPSELRVPLALRMVRDSGLGALGVRGMNVFARGAVSVGCKRTGMSAEIRAGYLAPYDTWKNRIATLRFVQDIPLSPSDPSYALVSQIEAGLEKFTNTPVLICWGERDFVFTSAVLDHWIRRWPHAEVHRFADCGHYVLEDAGPEIAAHVRRFLEQHPLAPLSPLP
ncbi:MAG: alpha/beta fold hydrolase [Polyangia bacterium]